MYSANRIAKLGYLVRASATVFDISTIRIVRMYSTRVPRTTIRRVPLEVLDDVLKQAFPREDDPLWLSHVCQLWYRRCQRPTLWTSLSTVHSTIALMNEPIIRSGTDSEPLNSG